MQRRGVGKRVGGETLPPPSRGGGDFRCPFFNSSSLTLSRLTCTTRVWKTAGQSSRGRELHDEVRRGFRALAEGVGFSSQLFLVRFSRSGPLAQHKERSMMRTTTRAIRLRSLVLPWAWAWAALSVFKVSSLALKTDSQQNEECRGAGLTERHKTRSSRFLRQRELFRLSFVVPALPDPLGLSAWSKDDDKGDGSRRRAPVFARAEGLPRLSSEFLSLYIAYDESRD